MLLGAFLANAAPLETRADKRPVFSIAHKILTVGALEDALYDKPSALEVDLTAWRKGDKGEGDDPADTSRWWMDHNGDGKSFGDPADVLLKAIGDKASADDQNIAFVMFDIKTPNYCEPDEEGCGMGTLVDMARDLVTSKGIRVVYGITTPDDASGSGFEYITQNLDDDTAVRITGQTDDVLKAYDDYGGAIPEGKRIIDYGNAYLDARNGAPEFGKCESADGDEVCPNLVKAVQARDDGKLGKVFGWTVGHSDYDGDRTNDMLDAGLDGIVYGYGMEEYEDSEKTLDAAQHILGWIADHSDIAYTAAREDAPWA
ncbi:phospholipase d [Aspergillus sclerotialis]|uniref:Phospholipase d n=1 Tax=Aspergillus sclerotialis TaxID=2070753 RepID=A0A3A2ZFQ1_9EURO|nr:phospholipase d [Aspergillus sclerotialis]